MNTIYHNIQGLRGIAVLVVIFFHLQGIEQKYSADQALPAVLQLGAVGVDLFFLISGFIMVSVTRNLAPGMGNLWRFLSQRVIRIYPLYWLVSGLVLAALLVRPDLVRAVPDKPHYLLYSLLLLPQEDLPLLSVGWTLVHEMYFYAVFCLLLLLPARWRLVALLLWSGLTVVLWQWWQPTQAQPWPYLLANPLTLEFTAGCVMAALLQRWQPPRPGLLALAGIAGMVLGWLYWRGSHTEPFPLEGMRVVCFLLPCALVLAGVVAMEAREQLLPTRLQQIGDASYALYLTHILILSVGGKLWQRYGDANTLLDNLLWLPALLLVTMVGGIWCHRWIEKPLLQSLRRLTARTV